MSDQFAGYLKLLALAQQHKTKAALREAISKAELPYNETEPLSGYYRCAAVKNGPLLPVAIWRDESGQLQVYRDGEPVALERVWPYCIWNPIPYEWYEAATERGEGWPDAHKIEPDPAPDTGEIYAAQSGAIPAANREVASSDNRPPENDEAVQLTNQVEKARAGLKQYSEITSDEQAAKAQDLRSKLNELANTADKKRDSEKRPYLDKCKEVDGRWQPIIKLAKAGADAIRTALKAYETKKFREQQEAERKRQEEVAAAQAAGKPIPEPQEETPPAQVVIKGATGRAASIKTIKVAKVVDQDAAYKHLRAVPEIRDAIHKVAQRMVNAGNNVPGVEVEEQRDVA